MRVDIGTAASEATTATAAMVSMATSQERDGSVFMVRSSCNFIQSPGGRMHPPTGVDREGLLDDCRADNPVAHGTATTNSLA